MNRYEKTEMMYTNQFSKMSQYKGYTVFDDPLIPGMYVHNFIAVHDLEDHEIIRLIEDQLSKRKAEGKDFFRLEFNKDVDLNFIKDLTVQPEIGIYELYAMETAKYETLKDRSCQVVLAVDDQAYEDGKLVDIEVNTPVMGEFAKRRIDRKLKAYRHSLVDFYVIYDQEPIGNCEYFPWEDTVKIEDFDIKPDFQRKGYGTACLRHLMKRAYDEGRSMAYLVTDADETAREMYMKCGFSLVGRKTELIFDF